MRRTTAQYRGSSRTRGAPNDNSTKVTRTIWARVVAGIVASTMLGSLVAPVAMAEEPTVPIEASPPATGQPIETEERMLSGSSSADGVISEFTGSEMSGDTLGDNEVLGGTGAETGSDSLGNDEIPAGDEVSGGDEESLETESLEAESQAAGYTDITFGGNVGDETYDSILGDAKYFNVVANRWLQSEAQTNAAVGTIEPSDQVGDNLSGLGRQIWVVGAIEGNNPLKIKEYETDLYLGKGHETKVENLKEHGFAGTKVNLYSHSVASIQAWVRGVIEGVAARSQALATKSSLAAGMSLPTPNTNSQPANQTTTNYELDFCDKSDGTYYVDVTSIYDHLDQGGLNILKKESQTVVLNYTGTSLQFKRYRINGKQSTETFADASTVIWNMPNAMSVDWAANATGTFLAPKAEVTMSNGPGAGWIVANTFNNMGGQEWHSTWRPTIPTPEPEPNNATGRLTATKTVVDDKDMTKQLDIADYNGKFTFTVTPQGNAPAPSKGPQVTNANGVVDFGTITFTKADTYVYTVKETKSTADGVTIDGSVYTATFEVSEADIQNGATITPTITKNGASAEGDVIAFVNKRTIPEPSSATAQFLVEKRLDGDADVLKNETYTFELKEGDKVIDTVDIKGSGSNKFKELSYDEVSEHTYTITEKAGTNDKITYDKTVYTVKVNVTGPNSEGKLQASTEYLVGDKPANKPVFTNHAVQPDEVVLKVDKTLAGNNTESLKNRTFTFVLEQIKGDKRIEIDTTTVTGEGEASFKPLSFDTKGTYHYEVTERATEGDGVVYDASVYKVTVEVVREGDALKATASIAKDGASYTEDDMRFENSVRTTEASVSFRGKKIVETADDSTWTFENDQFKFRLSAAQGTPMPEGAKPCKGGRTCVEVGNKGDAIDFGSIDFTESDLKGAASQTFTYTVTELDPDPAIEGMVIDKEIKTIAVTLDKDEDGNLQAVVNPNTAPLFTFTNTIPDKPEASFRLKAHKTLEGIWEDAIGISENQYQFNLVQIGKEEVKDFNPGDWNADGYQELAKREIVASTVNGESSDRENADAPFPEIAVDEAGTYHYVIYEVAPDELKDVEVPWESEISTVPGLTYDLDIAMVTVEVTEGADGKLAAEVTYLNDVPAKGSSDARFVNRYLAPQGRFAINGTKRFEGGVIKDGMFTFKIETVQLDLDGDGTMDTDRGPLPPNVDKSTGEIKNKGVSTEDRTVGVFRSDDINFTRPGVYWYKVTEIPDSDAGIRYDDTVYWVRFNLVDFAEDEAVVAEIFKGDKDAPDIESGPLPDESTVDFVNHRIDEEPGGTSIRLKGRKLLAYAGSSESLNFEGHYSFDLFDKNPSAEAGAEPIKTAFTDTNGRFEFAPITYSYDENELKGEFPKTYDYWIREVKGDDPGMTYDTHITKVTVTVTKDDQGVKASASYDNSTLGFAAWKKTTAEAIFVNTPPSPQPESGSLRFKASKRMASGSLGDRTFRFTLKAENSNSPMPDGAKNGVITVTNKGESVDFGSVTYTEKHKGTHVYTISEVAGSGGSNIVYDKRVYTATVTVAVDDNEVRTDLVYAVVAGNELGIGEVPEFVNDTPPPPTPGSKRLSTSLQLKVLKILRDETGQERQFSGEFGFELVDGSGKVIDTARTDASGWAVFKNLPTYEAWSTQRDGVLETHVYSIREIDESATHPDITYDRHVTKVTVTVTKKGGALTATATYDNSGIVTAPEYGKVSAYGVFVNIDPVETTLDGLKVMVAPDGSTSAPKSGQYRFKVTGKATPSDEGVKDLKAPMFSGVGADGVIANIAGGRIPFGTVEFEAPGTYVYTIRELTPADGEKAVAGVTYDTRVTTVTYVVKRNGSLKVASATIARTGANGKAVRVGAVRFENRTTPPPTTTTTTTTTTKRRYVPSTTTRYSLAHTGVGVTALLVGTTLLLAAGVTALAVGRAIRRR